MPDRSLASPSWNSISLGRRAPSARSTLVARPARPRLRSRLQRAQSAHSARSSARKSRPPAVSKLHFASSPPRVQHKHGTPRPLTPWRPLSLRQVLRGLMQRASCFCRAARAARLTTHRHGASTLGPRWPCRPQTYSPPAPTTLRGNYSCPMRSDGSSSNWLITRTRLARTWRHGGWSCASVLRHSCSST